MIIRLGFTALVVWLASFPAPVGKAGENWPELPESNGEVEIPAQEWPMKPGPRTVAIRIHYPGGKLANVTQETGLMLTLHNWGGTFCAGTANPDALANRLNVVAICVNYLQSGRKASVADPEPYDCGFLQSLDALRALWFVHDGLSGRDIPFAKNRILTTGGSGGGNVSLMANKLAPRTFSGVIDMCGMPKLSDDIAFNLPGGTGLNARWSRDPASPNFLSLADQEIRFVGNPKHLEVMKHLGASARVVVVHGRSDTTCPFADAEEMVANFRAAGLDVSPQFIGKDDLDGKVYTSSAHALGNRTEIAIRYSTDLPARKSPSDFDLRDEKVRYPVTGGEFVISYKTGYPVARFERTPNFRVLAPTAARLEPDREVVYKRVGDRSLHLHIFDPAERGAKVSAPTPVFLIIHGGGWTGGEPRKFYPIADHFARRGMMGISLEYRLLRKADDAATTVFDCVRDGRSAVRFLRENAADLGIDSDKIVVAGGSAGGHVAVGTALFDLDEPAQADSQTSPVPNALVLLNPVIDTSENGYGKAKIGDRWKELSPVDHVKPGLPPTILFHSTDDKVTPYGGAKRFAERSRAVGNDCELITYEGGRHGYFIFDLAAYREVMNRMTDFLKAEEMLP
ncbi:MAG: alpha/beta hydrolase fold domain-containing protein [Verrucomicrobiales bacterium]|nr:alpha/beta hydrolase fold domain-containing protein [Verrucomicrobiales bacterium]